MDDSKEELVNMDNIELKENILSINKKQLEKVKEASYLNLFHSILGVKKLLKDGINRNSFRFAEEIDIFNNYVERVINSAILSMDENRDVKKSLEGLKEIREELYEIHSILEGYTISISYIGELIDEYGIKLLTKKDNTRNPYDNKKVEDLINRINRILDDNRPNHTNYIYIISEIISILPMRLAKENYYNIVKKSLVRNLSSYNKSQVHVQIDDYKKQFDSSGRDGYGTKFDYYFTEIQSLSKIDLGSQSLEDLSSLINKNIEIREEINDLKNLSFILGLISNMNIVISLLDHIENSQEIRDLGQEWKEVLKSKSIGDLEDFILIIKEKIEGLEEGILKDLDRFQSLNIEAARRDDLSCGELDGDLQYTQTVLTYYNDSQFADWNILFPQDLETINQEYLEQLVESLIQYINRSTKNMDNIERRTRMRKLLSIIELPFKDIGDFINYIKYALDSRILAEEEIDFKINHINYFLNELSKT